ncbi:hypothetical protein [Desulfosporosinus sp. OT]|uniref:hypothetical protein n=1 Tax=Desulfosporosinus sp. OT TaxID=913865 RepID=UPI000223A2EA|nr:hypothetical protein [Desulfosporosinus sp. OT]EGW38527.1 putative membrane protein [Desulfosporosinus sp. OT]
MKDDIQNTKPKIGIGTISLILIIIGGLFSFSFDFVALGDLILNSLGLKAWSNLNSGIHYTIFYSLIFYIPALIISFKFKDDFGSRLGRKIAIIMMLFTLFSSFLING